MSGLRAEDVKEAATIYEEWLAETGNAPGPAMAPLLAAARLWLASQQQTPDYEAAARALYAHEDHGLDFDKLRAGMLAEDGLDLLADYIKDVTPIVDAALVGFHPQPEEEK